MKPVENIPNLIEMAERDSDRISIAGSIAPFKQIQDDIKIRRSFVLESQRDKSVAYPSTNESPASRPPGVNKLETVLLKKSVVL